MSVMGFRLMVCAIISLFVCSGCEPKVSKHGYVFDNAYNDSTVRVGDSMDLVILKLGKPSFTSMNGLSIYYSSYGIKNANPFGRRYVSTDTLELVFNEKKILKKKAFISKQDMTLFKSQHKGVYVTGINDDLLRNALKRQGDKNARGDASSVDKNIESEHDQ